MKNQEMKIENQMWEMESVATKVMISMEETNDYSDLYYELDGLCNDINFVKDDYEGVELIEAMQDLTDRISFLVDSIQK